MILQYIIDGKEIYQDSDAISTVVINLSEKSHTLESILESVKKKTGSGTFVDCDNTFRADESVKNLKSLRAVILSDGTQRTNNKVLLFGRDTPVYVLNNAGKTIKKL